MMAPRLITQSFHDRAVADGAVFFDNRRRFAGMDHAVVLNARARADRRSDWRSDRTASTAPHQMLASSPTLTSPINTAVGAMNALGEMSVFCLCTR